MWHAVRRTAIHSHLFCVMLGTGEPIATRWSAAHKVEIKRSRVGVTQRLTDSINLLPEAERPRVMVSCSAVGKQATLHMDLHYVCLEVEFDYDTRALNFQKESTRVSRFCIGFVRFLLSHALYCTNVLDSSLQSKL